MRMVRGLLIILALCVQLSPAHAQVRIAVLGDSITSGYMLTKEEGFSAQLRAKLFPRAPMLEILDFSRVDATTSSAYALLPALLEQRPDIVIVTVGYNDVARGLDVNDVIHTNLHYITATLRNASIPTLLFTMDVPDERGETYKAMLESSYQQLAFRNKVSLLRGMYRGFMGNPALTLADGIHPNRAGTATMVETLATKIDPILQWVVRKKQGKIKQ